MINHHTIGIIGLGYVGLTLAMAFSKKMKVIGFDKDINRIESLKKGKDRHKQFSTESLMQAKINYTSNFTELKNATFYIISVNTPLTKENNPNLSILLNATEMIAKILKKGDIVVFESTVYPGATEEECIPILESISGLLCKQDFGVGYSPERINPGDINHVFETIKKVISAVDESTLAIIEDIYNKVIITGTHRVSSIKVAEATKIIENTQRDLNIALMNEAAMILHRCNISISEVIDAAKTKWNFIPYQPGLIGGNCIGNNSHYFCYKARCEGIYSTLIESGIKVNEKMMGFVYDVLLEKLNEISLNISNARIAILGITYKANYPDFHASKMIPLIGKINAAGGYVFVHDPIADPDALQKEYDITLVEWDTLRDIDILIMAVSHQYYASLIHQNVEKIMKHKSVIMDIANGFAPDMGFSHNIHFWKI